MRLKNTSSYPTDEVRRLVSSGMKGVNTTGLVVHVRGSRSEGHGKAYRSIPAHSWAAQVPGARFFVELYIGARTRFPVDNLRTKVRWLDEMPAADVLESNDYVGQNRKGQWGVVVARHPYGGKRSPLIVTCDWKEMLVALAAHEARHIQQFQRHKRCSEVDAERFAANALERYRTSQARSE